MKITMHLIVDSRNKVQNISSYVSYDTFGINIDKKDIDDYLFVSSNNLILADEYNFFYYNSDKPNIGDIDMSPYKNIIILGDEDIYLDWLPFTDEVIVKHLDQLEGEGPELELPTWRSYTITSDTGDNDITIYSKNYSKGWSPDELNDQYKNIKPLLASILACGGNTEDANFGKIDIRQVALQHEHLQLHGRLVEQFLNSRYKKQEDKIKELMEANNISILDIEDYTLITDSLYNPIGLKRNK